MDMHTKRKGKAKRLVSISRKKVEKKETIRKPCE
jgi:hypothetical protein